MKKIALLSLTGLGMATAFANAKTPDPAPATGAAAARVAPETTGVMTLALPERKSAARGSASLYPFDTLTAVGQFFGVKNKDKRGMSSIISNQNKKHKVQVTDENGNKVFNTKTLTAADGSTTEVADTANPKMTYARKFEAIEVDAEIAAVLKGTEAEGSKVLVRRTA